MATANSCSDTIKIDSRTSSFIISIPLQQKKNVNLDLNDNLEKCLLYLDKTYNQNIWKSVDTSKQNKPQNDRIESDYFTGVQALIELFYGKNDYSINNTHLLNLKQFLFDESNQQFTLEFDTTNLKNLHQILLFSPRSIDNNHEKILFIFYQLLKLYKYLHSLNINCSELKLDDIYIDKNYWIRIKPPIKLILDQYLIKRNNSKLEDDNAEQDDENHEASLKFYSLKENLHTKYESLKHLNYKDLANLTKQWCDNKLSNFDYLLILNSISGRQLECPYNHPIFPWITDFTSFNTNLRDLSVSKFRLNKGDANLDLTYQAAKLNTDSTPAYHLTEFLSEITYFVYKSRITDKETLCEHVRRNWVPNEYPRSIDRLYMWTPEECIPEFYCDTSIFKSIHDDLPDLKVPDWCNGSIEEFIRTHRLLLESDLVSKKLHNWIDLVFGYKLSGDAAIEAKNVCLPLIDNHQAMKPFGIVQLFTIAHPYRATDKYYHSKQAPNIVNRSRLRGYVQDDPLLKVKYSSYSQAYLESEANRKRSVSTKLEQTNENLNSLIQLPEDYTNPLQIVDELEQLLKFTSKTYNCLPNDDNITTNTANNNNELKNNFEDFAWLDLKCLVCVLFELAYFSRIKCLPRLNNLETRCSFIQKLLLKEPQLITGPYAVIILSVLKPFGDSQLLATSNTATKKSKFDFYDNLNRYQVNFVNIDTLLNLNLTLLPFKSYFEQIYKFSYRYNLINNLVLNYDKLTQQQIRQELNFIIKLKQQQCDPISIQDLYDNLNQLSLSYIPLLMSELTQPKYNQLSTCCSYMDSFELVLTYLEDLFSNPKTCIDSFLYLFNKLSRYVSKSIMRKKFLPILLHILNVVDVYETLGLDLITSSNDEEKLKFCKLFEFKFINELRIIFGLKVFLTQICPFLVEAISGFKDLDYDLNLSNDFETANVSLLSRSDSKQMKSTSKQSKQSADQSIGIFYMESDLLNKVDEEEDLGDDLEDVDDDDDDAEVFSLNKSSKSLDVKSNESVGEDPSVNDELSRSLNKQPSSKTLMSTLKKSISSNKYSTSVPNLNNDSLSIDSNDTLLKAQINLSTTAFNTFIRLIGSLGPVLTCKYCCNDLLKMLAICYMNSKCFNLIETNDNPLNSVRAIEGDRFACLILESLKSVAILYGDQVIISQYFTHVSNSISACVIRLTLRLEASLIAGIILVNYFISYLDMKLLMEYLNYILNQILQPVINLLSNESVKFPNGSLTRQALAFKVLDIILLLGYRIGPEQTRIEMEFILKAYFNSFYLVRNTILNQTSNQALSTSKPLVIKRNQSVFKQRTSIVAFSNSSYHRTTSKNSLDEYYKFSYDKSTNELIGTSLKADTLTADSDTSTDTYTSKYRTHSIGLLSLNLEENDQPSPASTEDSVVSSVESSNNTKVNDNDEIINTFTCELAHTAYFSVSRLNSGVYIDSILKHSDLIHQMCILFEQENKQRNKTLNYLISNPNSDSKLSTTYGVSNNSLYMSKVSKNSSSYGSSFSENVSLIGNQIQLNRQDSSELNKTNNETKNFVLKFSEQDLRESKSKIDTSRHLSDNWLAYWENEIRSNESKSTQFDFKHINLLTLNGHTSSVKCLLALENESSLISGSKDKTVKLWNIKNQFNTSRKSTLSCQWTYAQHKKPVLNVIFIESQRVCASSDGTVHVWDPFQGKRLFQLDNQIVVNCMTNLEAPASSFVVSTSDNLVKFVDLRLGGIAQEFRTCHTTAGSIKSMSSNEHQLLVSFSTGIMCLVDMRTGWIIETYKSHDNEIVQSKFYAPSQLVCTYQDGSIGLYTVKEKISSKNFLKAYSEPIVCLSTTENQLITSTSSNKIGIHSNVNDPTSQINFALNKLQPEYFKGFITSQTYLKLNRLLLIGSDYGDIRVIC